MCGAPVLGYHGVSLEAQELFDSQTVRQTSKDILITFHGILNRFLEAITAPLSSEAPQRLPSP
jgi:hypothetical protein